MAAGARSLIRRIGAGQDLRKRRYGLRALVIVAVCLGCVLFVKAVQTRIFDPDGPGRVIYLLHDFAYLGAKGHAWVRHFPYALVWLVPAAVVTVLILWEFLSRNGLVRRLHAQVILFCAARPVLQRMLGGSLHARPIDDGVWNATLDPERSVSSRRFGFARRVIRSAQDGLWRDAAVAIGDGNPVQAKTVTYLFRLTRMRLRLDPSDPLAHLRALEISALFAKHDAGRTLRNKLKAIYEHPANRELTRPLQDVMSTLDTAPDLTPDTAASKLSAFAPLLVAGKRASHGGTALRLSCLVLRASILARCHPVPEALALFRYWVDRRLQDPSFRHAADLSERMIYFELWSRLAEPAATQRSRNDLMAAGLNTHMPALLDASEAYAWTGGQA